MKKRYFLPLLLAVILLTLSLSACQRQTASAELDRDAWLQHIQEQRVLSAEIVSVDDHIMEDGEGVETTVFTARLTDPQMNGQIVKGRMVVYSYMGYRAQPLKAGANIFLQPALDEWEQPLGEFADYDRTLGVVALVVLFAVVLCLVGGRKGFRSLISLIVTCAGLAFIFIPMVLRGASPIGASLLICTLVTLVTLLVISGFNVKTVSSLIGIVVGLLIAGLLSVIFQSAMHLTGLVDNEAIRLTTMPGMEGLSMNGLMFAAILIGSLGACMDTAVSLASALEELHAKSGLHGVEMVKSGMKIGRDTMGTMTNTLVLAYVGGSLHLVLLLAMDLSQLGYLISWEILSTEVLRAMAGSIGLIAICPATAIVCALLYRRKSGDANPFS